MKLAYIVERRESGKSRRSLIFGSANATRQSFSRSINAELIASCRLTKSSHSSTIRWCEHAVAAITAGRCVEIAAVEDILGIVRLRLPSIRVGPSALANSFDLWVQRGSLLATYQPEPGFLKVPITLKRDLDVSEQSRVVALSGFDAAPTNRITFAYVGGEPASRVVGDPDGAGYGTTWRSQYFTRTNLGFWCSEACLADRGDMFHQRGHVVRAEQLSRLRDLRRDEPRRRRREAFLSRLGALWTGFGSEAPGLLTGSDTLDARHYTKLFEKAVSKDLELIEDEAFCDRYLSGFEITPVPRFRTDLRGWNEFIESMMLQLVLSNARPQSRSRLLHAIRAEIDAADDAPSPLDDPRTLLKSLHALWGQDAGVGQHADRVRRICAFHAQDS